MPDDRTDWDTYLDGSTPSAARRRRSTTSPITSSTRPTSPASITSASAATSTASRRCPTASQTAAGLPLLTARLMERGMSEGDVEKVLGGNFMRVFSAVEAARQS